MRRLEKTTESEERRFTTCQLQALCMLRVLFPNSPEFMSDMMNPKFTQLILLIFLITILNFTESSKYLEYCSSDQQCEAGLICETFTCVCNITSNYNGTSQMCEKRSCSIDQDCHTYEKNTKCLNGNCVCSAGYALSAEGKCKKERQTESVDTCIFSSQCGLNKRCVDGICRCNPNHHLDNVTKKCQYLNFVTSQINC